MVTTDCEGATQAWADLEHLAATDSFGKQHAAMLSAPMPVMSFDFSSLTALPPASRSVTLDVPATVSGVLNCVTFWWVPIGARICPERRVGPDCAASRWQVRSRFGRFGRGCAHDSARPRLDSSAML